MPGLPDDVPPAGEGEVSTKRPTLVFGTPLAQRDRVVASVEEIVGRIH